MVADVARTYTASEASRELGVSPSTIRNWLRDGLLTPDHTVLGRGTYVTAASVMALKAAREAANTEAQR